MEGVHQLIVHAKRTCFSLVSRSGAPTPRNRREAASRCRCSAERSARGVRAQAKHRQTVSFPEKKMDEKRFFCTQLRMEKRFAPSGNRTRVCTVAGYYSTTRPTVRACLLELWELLSSHSLSIRNFRTHKSFFLDSQIFRHLQRCPHPSPSSFAVVAHGGRSALGVPPSRALHPPCDESNLPFS